MGPGLPGKNDATIAHENNCMKTSINKIDRCTVTTDVSKNGKPSSREQKRKEFRRIARYMGMEELEFSKWLLSASHWERNEMLQNCKKKKKR